MEKALTLFFVACCPALQSMGQPPTYVPTNGLVAWYSFTGNASDLSGGGHDGTVSSPVLANDRCGPADGSYFFNGDDHIALAATDTFGLSAFSISAWARFSDISGALAVVSKHVNFSQNGFGMGVQNDQVLFAINNGSSAQVGSAQQYGDSAWHLLTGTFDGDSMVLYVDTVAVGSMGLVAPPNPNGMNVRIGMDSDLAAFQGNIDDVGLWSRALSPAEVAQLYEECSTAGIVDVVARPTMQVHPTSVPVGGTVFLASHVGDAAAFQVVDLGGQLVQSGALVRGRATLTMDRPGVYLLRAMDGTHAKATRIVVQ